MSVNKDYSMNDLMKFSILLLLLVIAPLVSPQTQSQGLTDPEPVIEAVQESENTDSKIEFRIESIFQELDSLLAVKVFVKQGVVTLSGEVANEAAAQQANRLAIRLEGVVTVEDEITRTLAVRDNVEPVINNFKASILNLVKAAPLIALALLVVTVATFLGIFLSNRKTLLNYIAPNRFLAELMSQALRIAMFLIGVVIALNLLGAGAVVTTILGGAGVIGLAIGFAVRDSMENYISSIMLSLRQPFRAKDHVIINDHEGIVVRLTSRATILMTMDGNHLRIPNSTVFKGIILNYTTNPERRFDFKLGVDAEDDPVAAMKTGLDAIQALEFVLGEPAPSAVISDVGDSSIVIKFSGWVDQTTSSYGKARSLAIRAAMQSLEANGFTLPEPIYRLRLDSIPAKQVAAAFDTQPLAAGTQNQSVAPRKNVTSPPAEIGEQLLDVAPDTHLAEKVDEEIRSDGEGDLLDEDRPRE